MVLACGPGEVVEKLLGRVERRLLGTGRRRGGGSKHQASKGCRRRRANTPVAPWWPMHKQSRGGRHWPWVLRSGSAQREVGRPCWHDMELGRVRRTLRERRRRWVVRVLRRVGPLAVIAGGVVGAHPHRALPRTFPRGGTGLVRGDRPRITATKPLTSMSGGAARRSRWFSVR